MLESIDVSATSRHIDVEVHILRRAYGFIISSSVSSNEVGRARSTERV
jgi:hypothetical protein